MYHNNNEAEVEAESDIEVEIAAERQDDTEAESDIEVEIAAERQDDTDDLPLGQEMDEKYGPRTGEYELRPRRPRDYCHLHTTLESTVMTQHNMKKGINIFGDAGVDAVLKELQQLHDRKALVRKDASPASKRKLPCNT